MFPHLTKRNQIALVELFALECFIETRLNRLVVQTESSPSATELLRELARTARQHQDAVRKRLADAGFCCEDGRPEGISGVSPGDGLVGLYPASAALRDAYVLVSQGLIGWATIFPLGHPRARQLGDGGRGHLGAHHASAFPGIRGSGRTNSLTPSRRPNR